MQKKHLYSAITLTSGFLLSIGAAHAVDYQTTISNEARWDNNIYKTDDKVDDFVNELFGEIEVKHTSGIIAAEGAIYGSLLRYLEESDEDAENFGATAALTFPSVTNEYPYYASIYAGFDRNSAPDPDVGDIIESDVFSTGFEFEYDITSRYGFHFDVDFADNEFNKETTRDFTSTAFTTGGYYDYSEKLRFNTGYTYTIVDIEGENDASSGTHTVFIGAEGNLFTRSVGKITIGGTYRDFDSDDFDSSENFFADIDFTWTGSELWAVNLGFSNQFEDGANNESRFSTTGTIGITVTPTKKLTWGTSVFASSLDYQGSPDTTLSSPDSADRTDTEYGASASVAYIFTKNLKGSLEAEYSERSSDYDSFDFDQTLITAQIAYTF